MQVLAGTEDWLIQKETQERTTSRMEGTYVSRMKKSTFLRRAKCSTSLGYCPMRRHRQKRCLKYKVKAEPLTIMILRVRALYLSRTQPLTQWYSSSPHCTELAAVCPDPSQSHSLESSRRPRPAGCSPLTTHREVC